MMNFIFYIFVLVLCSSALACEVILPQQMVLLGSSVNITHSIKHQNCSEQELNNLAATLEEVNGRITASHLVRMLSDKISNLNVTPQVFQIQQFKQIVHEQLNLPAGIQMKNSQAINQSNFLALNEGDRLEIKCIGCLYGTAQNLNLNILHFDGSQRSVTVRADFIKMVKAYRLMTSTNAFMEIPSSSLKEEFVESIPHTDLVTDLDTLKFYKLNKPVKAGTLLRKSDLNALSLVRAGMKTEVIMENSLLKIKTHGISRNSGSLGEMVEVFHPQKNKKYYGKVIDINKVLVEL